LPDEAGSATHQHLVLLAGKESRIYLLDRDNLGHFNAGGDSQIVQSVAGQLGTSRLISSPAYWNGRVYFQSGSDVLKAFSLNNATLSSTPASTGTVIFGYPGAPPVVSSNGVNNGIVWVFQKGPGTLQAYDATDLTKELYTSPALGTQVPFATPIVANGKVYIGTTNQVVGYGLLP
jgi:outer membrane protein assembly factor BamB